LSLDHAEFAPFGVLAPVMDPANPMGSGLAAWTAAVTRLLDHPDERAALAAAGRQRMEAFRPETIVGQWVGLIDRLCRA
jgi:hypothetical protein